MTDYLAVAMQIHAPKLNDLTLHAFQPLVARRAARLTRALRRGLCTCDTLSEAPFAGTGAETRSTIINTGAHDSDSAPSLRPPGTESVPWQGALCAPCQVEFHSRLVESGSAG